MIAPNAIQAIDAVRIQHPLLAWYGFGPRPQDRHEFHRHRSVMTEPWQVAQFQRAIEWLQQAKRTRTVRRRHTSYGWKHVAERWHGRKTPDRDPYVAEGMFIAAAIHLGFQTRPLRGGMSVWLNIAEASHDCP